MKISKELFEEVRGSFNKEIFELILKGNSIEINSFFFKCKEWAFNKGYSISTHQSELSGYILELRWGWSVIDFHNKFEPEAIIQACEWALKEINEKQLQH